jgi:hypothetical protein
MLAADIFHIPINTCMHSFASIPASVQQIKKKIALNLAMSLYIANYLKATIYTSEYEHVYITSNTGKQQLYKA